MLREALNAEHGAVERDDSGLDKIAIMTAHQADGRGRRHGGGRSPRPARRSTLLDDDSVAYRLGRSVARMEAAMSTPEIFGRVAIAQTMRDVSPDLMDILGAASALPVGTDGAADDGARRVRLPVRRRRSGIYGGTLEVFRNMIAQHVLGLGKPNYSPVAKKKH